MLLLIGKRIIKGFPITNSKYRKFYLASLLFVFRFIIGSILIVTMVNFN